MADAVDGEDFSGFDGQKVEAVLELVVNGGRNDFIGKEPTLHVGSKKKDSRTPLWDICSGALSTTSKHFGSVPSCRDVLRVIELGGKGLRLHYIQGRIDPIIIGW